MKNFSVGRETLPPVFMGVAAVVQYQSEKGNPVKSEGDAGVTEWRSQECEQCGGRVERTWVHLLLGMLELHKRLNERYAALVHV
jgi:hypothetical protein